MDSRQIEFRLASIPAFVDLTAIGIVTGVDIGRLHLFLSGEISLTSAERNRLAALVLAYEAALRAVNVGFLKHRIEESC